jgi:2-succinyl-5-enolpyruvyl-6-hydroxy-3-cyclohexene-1-carboxylate synthase
MHVATDMFQTNPSQFASDLSGMLEISPNKEWTERWLSFRDLARTTMLKHLDEIGEMFEGKIFNQLAKLIPSKATLLAGNSMPVRDLDSFFPSNSKQTRFLANRGASGIDGVLSTALGTSAVSLDPTVLVVGDLSFYHDMNGLLASKKYRLNTTIVLANNNGGGIFSFLPQHEYPESFEKYFGTPHGLSFQTAAALYDLPYSKVTSWDGFDSAVSGNVNRSRTAIIEMQTERERNVELHRKIWSAVQTVTESKLM